MAPDSMLPVPARAQQRWALLAVCLAALALPLSFSAGAVAVPALSRPQWHRPLRWPVTNAFMLTFGSLLLAAGGLADRHGRRRMFLLGTVGFTLATAAVCLSPTLLWLDLARGLQGVAAAAALASGTAALAQGWQGPRRARVFALLGTTFGAGLALGPLLRPAAAGAGLAQRVRCGRCADVGGVRTGRARVARKPWRAPTAGYRRHAEFQPDAGCVDPGPAVAGRVRPARRACTTGAAGDAVVGRVFVTIERRHPSPLLDLSLFSQPAFLGVQLLPVATCFGYVVLLVVLPLQLLGVLGQSPTQVGLQMLALSAPMLVLPLLAARWAERVGSARLALWDCWCVPPVCTCCRGRRRTHRPRSGYRC